jgi:hypothetical protein
MSDLLLNNKLTLFYIITFLRVTAKELEAFNTYLKAKIKAVDNKIPLAPVDSK